MKNIIATTVLAAVLLAPAAFATEQEEVDQAATILRKFEKMPEKQIPPRLLRDARGVAILTIVKGGFGISGQVGRGVVVARTSNGWSGPAFVGTGGAGFGFQIGGELNEVVLILNTDAAVRAFMRGGNVNLGGDVSVAAGPVGRDVAAGGLAAPVAAVYSYSRSQGLFAGVSLNGAVIISRPEANADYYGRHVKVSSILSGKAAPPAGSRRLIAAL